MKAQSVAFDGRHPEPANVNELGLVRLTVVEEFFAEKTVEPGVVDVERCQLLPFLSHGLAKRVTRNQKKWRGILNFFGVDSRH